MFTASVNDKKYRIESLNDSLTEGLINGNPFKIDISSHNHYLHLIKDNRSFKIFVLNVDKESKKACFKINNKTVTVEISDEIDTLLNSMGIDTKLQKKENHLRAPMPGMINKILVNKGDSVKKGDTVLVLEAMKMENNLKAPHDAVIKDIPVKVLKSVEKNEILVTFE